MLQHTKLSRWITFLRQYIHKPTCLYYQFDLIKNFIELYSLALLMCVSSSATDVVTIELEWQVAINFRLLAANQHLECVMYVNVYSSRNRLVNIS